MKFEIKTTATASHVEALSICKKLACLVPPDNESVTFDFNGYMENNPFSNLVIINALKRIRSDYPSVDMRVQPNSNTYLPFVGFYKAMGVDFGNGPGMASGSKTYVPVTELHVSQPTFYNELGNTVKKLAATLEFDSFLEYTLKYVFQESIRNVHEHAMTDNVLVAAQKWPSRRMLEIAIADTGCGIAGSLGRLYDKPQLELLKLACQPGITAQSNATYVSDDIYKNSGYGLYVMKELALKYMGRFMICSGKHAIAYSNTNGVVMENNFATDYEGLALCLQLRTDQNVNPYSEIQSIANHGEEIASRIAGAVIESSKSSRNLVI